MIPVLNVEERRIRTIRVQEAARVVVRTTGKVLPVGIAAAALIYASVGKVLAVWRAQLRTAQDQEPLAALAEVQTAPSMPDYAGLRLSASIGNPRRRTAPPKTIVTNEAVVLAQTAAGEVEIVTPGAVRT